MDFKTLQIFLVAVLSWLPFLAVGQLLQLEVVRRWRPQSSISGLEAFWHGPFLSFIIWGSIGTALACLGLFRAEAFIAVLLVMGWYCRCSWAIYFALWFEIGHGFVARMRRGHWLLPAAALLLFWAFLSTLPLTVLPEESADVWAFQLPIARQIVAWSGFNYDGLGLAWPGFSNHHYSNMPLFGNMLFAQSLLWRDAYAMPSIANLLLFYSMLLAIGGMARRHKGIGYFTLAWLFAMNPDFFGRATMPLTDLIRSCFTVMAFVYAYRASTTRDRYYVVACSFCVGAALGTKYTELSTAALCLALLMPFAFGRFFGWPLERGRDDRRALAVAAVTAAVIASYWYVKNWICLGNPIYPFLFAHPGQTDTEIAAYMKEMSTALDPSLRALSRNLLTVQGWRDYASVFIPMFWQQPHFKLAVLFFAGAAVFWRNKLWTLLALNVVLFINFYVLMFNERRWAVPANLLLYTGGWLGLIWWLARFWRPVPRLRSLVALAQMSVLIWIVIEIIQGRYPFSHPPDLTLRQRASLSSEGRQKFLSETRPGFLLAHFAEEQGVDSLWNPFAGPCAYFFNPEPHELPPGKGKPIMIFNAPPWSAGSATATLQKYRPQYALLPLQASRSPELDRFRSELGARMELAKADQFGWGLYKIVPGHQAN